MGFKTNDSQQITMYDRGSNLTEREMCVLEKSWAGVFARDIFPWINEERFSVLYAENGRGNTPVNVVIGSLIIKELLDLTDEELVEAMLLNVQVQYALHLTSFSEIPYSDRTPSRFRERLYAYEQKTGVDLLRDEVRSMAQHAKDMLGISDKLRRMDSLMVSSHCKQMARIELIYTCNANMVAAYIEQNGSVNSLPERLWRYSDISDKNATIYRMKSGESVSRLDTVAEDAVILRDICAGEFSGDKAFEQLSRMISDQMDGNELKNGREIKPTSLQNPSDEDATYRRKAGKGYTGYVGNIVECCDNELGNIIEDYSFEQNIHSDQTFGREVIDQIGDCVHETILIADGAYGSEGNIEAAENHGIKMVSTNLTGLEPNRLLFGFELNGNIIVRCPAGAVPYDTSYNPTKDTFSAYFEKGTCEGCPHRAECMIVQQRKRMAIKFTGTAYNRSVYSANLKTDEYKNYARVRNGVEGVPSVLRRKYNVDSMPVFGLKRSRLWFGLKIAATNVRRVIALSKETFTAASRKYSSAGEVCLS
jgi:hypothetical protein